jgi:TM2 domain-containing membrane protein YozV
MPEFTITEQQMMIQDLTDSQRLLFSSQFDGAKKDRNMILVLSVIFGYLGVDRFIVGDIGIGILKLLTLGLCGILWLVDLFLIRGRVDEKNRQVANEIYMGIKMMNRN